MPYSSKEKLNALIERSLADVDIKSGIAEAGLIDEFLKEHIESQTDLVWASEIEQIQTYNILENEILSIDQEIKLKLQGFSKISKEMQQEKPEVGLLLSGIFCLSGLFIYLFYKAKYQLKGLFYPYKSSTALWIISIFLVVYVIWSIIIYFLSFQKYRRFKRERWIFESHKRDLEEKFNLDQKKARKASLEKKIDDDLVDAFIKDELRRYINYSLKPTYSLKFEGFQTQGLAEVIDTSKTIDTGAKKRLDFLLNNMPGGSIGIAGSRGAGKSTLIQSYCGPKRSVDKIKGKLILSVLTTAPVQYDAREFILHLFALTCNNFLRLENATIDIPEEEESDNTESNNNPIVLILRTYFSWLRPSVILNIGLILLFTSIFSAYMFTYSNVENGLEENAIQDSLKIQKGRVDSVQKNKTDVKDDSKEKNKSVDVKEVASVRFLHALNVNPGALFIWGVILLVIGYNGRINVRRRREVELDKFREKSLMEYREISGTAKAAQKWVRQIKFQQSFTSGWSGSLKTPIGLEGSINKGITLLEKQMSNPDIVAAFIEFIESIPPAYQIIIGIDELDKLESDELAHKFLNEIKSIFGLNRCFYLISVSENAMSNFERRGLPFRDVFDSSFDNVVYVDYLDLSGSIKLLERRVIGKPMLFFCLSYCMSGGLPRDLIRIFRRTVELAHKSNCSDMDDSLSQIVIKDEIMTKLKAISFSAKRVESISDSEKLFNILFYLQSSEHTVINLVKSSRELYALINDLKEKERVQLEGKIEAYNALLTLSEEFCAYIVLMITLLEFFNDQFDEPKQKMAEKNGDFKLLASARQALSVDPAIVHSLVSDFRNIHQMQELNSSID